MSHVPNRLPLELLEASEEEEKKRGFGFINSVFGLDRAESGPIRKEVKRDGR